MQASRSDLLQFVHLGCRRIHVDLGHYIARVRCCEAAAVQTLLHVRAQSGGPAVGFTVVTCSCRLYDREVPPASLALLNAKPENVRREAQIIAQAGLPGAVTIATNMAGRGTDIVLGGNPKGLALQVLMKVFARYFITGCTLRSPQHPPSSPPPPPLWLNRASSGAKSLPPLFLPLQTLLQLVCVTF